jgi:Sulfotransferase family
MPPPLFLLCPPRSFSSVICAMLGQHPQMYGFPELNLFLADKVDEILGLGVSPRGGLVSGLLRALAQLNEGRQTARTVEYARRWLENRRGWSVQLVFNHVRRCVAPRIAIDKSPLTALFPHVLERARVCYPTARFLHVTRHPATALPSLAKFVGVGMERRTRRDRESREARSAFVWCAAHTGILAFTQKLPRSQTMCVRGEDLLSRPDVFVPRLAQWLGVSMDAEAIDATKHPERSPYARTGPRNAPLGNDPHFQARPKLNPAPLPTDLSALSGWKIDARVADVLRTLTAEMGYTTRAVR